MTKSYAKGQIRRYKKEHPWARKLPKMKTKRNGSVYADTWDEDKYYVGGKHDFNEVDLSLIDNQILKQYNEMWDRLEGDGSWAIVYDESRSGEWLWQLADNGWADHVCSECKYTINTDIHVSLGEGYERCPRCGANMTRNHGITFGESTITMY